MSAKILFKAVNIGYRNYYCRKNLAIISLEAYNWDSCGLVLSVKIFWPKNLWSIIKIAENKDCYDWCNKVEFVQIKWINMSFRMKHFDALMKFNFWLWIKYIKCWNLFIAFDERWLDYYSVLFLPSETNWSLNSCS